MELIGVLQRSYPPIQFPVLALLHKLCLVLLVHVSELIHVHLAQQVIRQIQLHKELALLQLVQQRLNVAVLYQIPGQIHLKKSTVLLY